MELREQFPTMRDVRHLEQVGFSKDQIADLLRVKVLYQREASDKASSERKRLEFVRWLYLHGHLES